MKTEMSRVEVFTNERDPNQQLLVRHKTFGEPFAEGLSFNLELIDEQASVMVDLQRHEMKRLYDLIGRLLGEKS